MNKRPNYDETFCGKLPLHNINLIQPHGYLLVADLDNLNIIQASENCGELLGSDATSVAGTPLQQWVSKPVSDMTAPFSGGDVNRLPFYLQVNTAQGAVPCLALVHTRDGCLLVELFCEEKNNNDFVSVYQTLKHCFAELEQADGIEELAGIATRQLREISGFDRVLIYKFDRDWNGSVVAESRQPDIDSYLGQQFPASDIPKQARAMYRKNAYRLIPDRHYTPVRLYPVINPKTHAFTDLSDCSIRSVAGVHLEYLKNMGISASVSFRLLEDEQLWGLISLHNRAPKHLSYETCSMLELLASALSNHLRIIIRGARFRFSSKLLEMKSDLQEQVFRYGALPAALLEQPLSVLQLFHAGGAAIMLQGRLSTTGQVPPYEFIENLAFWLQSKNFGAVYTTENLPAAFEEAGDYDQEASGLMALTLDQERGDFLLLFRPEQQTTINWGGDPAGAVQISPDRKSYHPRNSFANFQELVRQTSADWQEAEIKVANELRHFLFEYLVKHP